MLYKKLLLIAFLILLTGCQTKCQFIEPTISYSPSCIRIESLPSAFPELTSPERRMEWGKELVIGNGFARECDFYRAITAYKRALFLMPSKEFDRRRQIEFCILQCYYIAGKYPEVIQTFECSTLADDISQDFPPLEDLLILLIDSNEKTGNTQQSCYLQSILEMRNRPATLRLTLAKALLKAEIGKAICTLQEEPEIVDKNQFNCFVSSYDLNKKSVSTARKLNTLLPGAGYLYVGQRSTALTSFAINALFIAAAYHFFHQGNYAAGIILTSLESGWYFGGINGAGLAAKQYNQTLYEGLAKEYLIKTCLFPILMLKYSF